MPDAQLKYVALRVVPMGWSWAPWLTQVVAICRVLLYVYIDDFGCWVLAPNAPAPEKSVGEFFKPRGCSVLINDVARHDLEIICQEIRARLTTACRVVSDEKT